MKIDIRERCVGGVGGLCDQIAKGSGRQIAEMVMICESCMKRAILREK